MAMPIGRRAQGAARGRSAGAGLRRFCRLLAVVLLPALAACSAGNGGGLGDDESQSGPRITYDVRFEGPADSTLVGQLRAASTAAQETGRPPPSLAILRNRARGDVPRLEATLRSEGYYEGAVGFRIDEDPAPPTLATGVGMVDQALGAVAAHVVFEVEPGPLYHFLDRKIEVIGDPHGYEAPSPGKIGLREGEPARADVVIAAESSLLRDARVQGHAMARVGDRRSIIDPEIRTMDVELAIEPGPVLHFATPVVFGQTDIDDGFLEQRTKIVPGRRYDPADVERAQQRLIDTNLFAAVRVIEGPEPDADGNWPVSFEVTERKPRTIGAGVGYVSDEGPNVRAFWEHRNILGAAERLRVEAELGQSVQRLQGQLRKPDIFMPDLDLLAGGSLSHEDTDAFESTSIQASLGVERHFNKRLSGTLGVAYRLADVEDQDNEEERFALLSIPAGLRYDRSDSLLDPSTGYRIVLETAPYWDTLNPGTQFLKSQLTGTRYFRLAKNPRLVLAFRGIAGSIVGASINEIPADERFYAGGGGTVRGVPFQRAGPLDDGEPTGGRSLLAANAEVRYRVVGNLEGVVFLDGGSAFEPQTPELNEAWQFGTGAGVRYISPVGPIRADVGVPVDRRKGIDDAWQLYISIGQAF
ncbi:MAG: outer membrane protein assembly factor [Geminicoccaceae bacterium]|nr:outer membrane protein assembly factor [Geminicoccaceae bacterium]